jgi:glycosyltransferase involved in cell wall biosynthesis
MVLVLGGRKEPRFLADHPARRAGQIVYLPTTDRPEQCLSALDVFLYPARYEEFGIVVLEAMAMGIPVVTSTAVGASELVTEVNRAGVLAAPSDGVSAYSEQVTSVLQMSAHQRLALAETSAEVARQYTSDRHNAAVYALLADG